MIQNTVVFIVNGDGSFFKQPPNTKFTANSVNKNSIFVIAPFVNTASIIANFKVANKSKQDSRVATLTTMQPREITNESYVFDWNVWEVKVPQPALQFLSNNRGTEILVSFNVGETTPSRVPTNFDTILGEIANTEFILPNITVDGRYIVKVASYEYENGKYAFFNDTIIADNTAQEYIVYRAKYSGGLTPSVAFKVDPSIPMENFDEYEPTVVEQLIIQANENSGDIVNLENEVVRIDDKIDDEITRVEQEAKDYTYSKVEIDNKDTAIMNKANNLENANMLKDVVYNNVNGVLTFTKYDNTTKAIDLPLELLVNSGYYDEDTNELVLVLANSSEIRIPVGNLLTDLDAHNIRFNGSGTNYLVNKLDVESAVKELDKKVKTNADNLVLKQDKLIAGANISIIGNTISAIGGGGGGGITDAPSDNKLYGRKNNTWEEVELDAEDVGALPDDTPLFSGDYDNLSNKPTIDKLLGNLSTLGFVKRTGTNTYVIDTSSYQPLDADLSSIAGLSGTSGLLKKTASNTWQLDTSVYLTAITKAQVEAVLTGTITTHTHNASAIVEDASHRFVADTEKNTWNAKQSALGFTPENVANKKTTLSDSDVDYPTSKAVKTAIETAVSQTLKPMGNWNANTNTPTLTNSNINKANEMYYVNVAGTQFGINFDVGDELVYNTNGVIFRRDNVDSVVSVNTKKGVVVLSQDDIGDGATYKQVSQAEKTTWNNKVDKVAGKGLSTNDYTTTEKNKLAGIASGAEVNVQSDWNATSGDAFILNKPAIPTKTSDLTNDTGYITGYTETDPIFTAWNKSTGISITKSQVSDFPTSMPPTAHSTNLLTSGTLGVARGGTGRTDGYAVGVVETRASVLTKIWTGTQAQYDAIGTKDANTLYFII